MAVVELASNCCTDDVIYDKVVDIGRVVPHSVWTGIIKKVWNVGKGGVRGLECTYNTPTE
ncbi:hypothetical protein E2I00_010425 [Balaenoptera physalus]|uniref:Uncharacterized protein n=1 Tax=Balaenoptera physalus TaxID=9770 RepID=A0A6A1Q371_BALPH|nr:hypothetical protein E2I00_010425 [Balaenoptera physalus]